MVFRLYGRDVAVSDVATQLDKQELPACVEHGDQPCNQNAVVEDASLPQPQVEEISPSSSALVVPDPPPARLDPPQAQTQPETPQEASVILPDAEQAVPTLSQVRRQSQQANDEMAAREEANQSIRRKSTACI